MTSIVHKYFVALFPGHRKSGLFTGITDFWVHSYWAYGLLILNELNLGQLKKCWKHHHHWKFYIQLGDRNIKDDVSAALSSSEVYFHVGDNF